MKKMLVTAFSCLCFAGSSHAINQKTDFQKTGSAKDIVQKTKNLKKNFQKRSKLELSLENSKLFLDLNEISDKPHSIERSKNGTEYILKKRHGFGLAPRITYNIYKSINGYVNFGTMFSKYKVTEGTIRKKLEKRTLFAGLGLETTFGTMFVRGEFNKVYKKSISKINDINLKKRSYTFKIASGYRF